MVAFLERRENEELFKRFYKLRWYHGANGVSVLSQSGDTGTDQNRIVPAYILV